MLNLITFWDDDISKTWQRRGRPNEAWIWRLMNLVRWPMLLSLVFALGLIALLIALPILLPGIATSSGTLRGAFDLYTQTAPILSMLCIMASGLMWGCYWLGALAILAMLGEYIWTAAIFFFNVAAPIYRFYKAGKMRAAP